MKGDEGKVLRKEDDKRKGEGDIGKMKKGSKKLMNLGTKKATYGTREMINDYFYISLRLSTPPLRNTGTVNVGKI